MIEIPLYYNFDDIVGKIRLTNEDFIHMLISTNRSFKLYATIEVDEERKLESISIAPERVGKKNEKKKDRS